MKSFKQMVDSILKKDELNTYEDRRANALGWLAAEHGTLEDYIEEVGYNKYIKRLEKELKGKTLKDYKKMFKELMKK